MDTLKENLQKLSKVGKDIIKKAQGEPIKTLYGAEVAGGAFGVYPKFHYFETEKERDAFVQILRNQEALNPDLYYVLEQYTMKYYRNILDQEQVVSKTNKEGNIYFYAPTERVDRIMEFNPMKTLYEGEFIWEERKGRLKEELEAFANKNVQVEMNFIDKKSRKSK